MSDSTNSSAMPANKKRSNVFVLIILIIVFIALLVLMYIAGLNNTANTSDNTSGLSTQGLEVELEQLGLPLEYEETEFTDLPQTGQSCYVPTPAISCSPTPSGNPTSVPATKTPTPTLKPGTTKTPVPTSTLLPTLSPNYVEMPSYVFLTVLDSGNCKPNIKGFYINQQLVGHKIAGQAYLPYFTVLNGKGWKFDKVFNTRMQGEGYYRLNKGQFTYYATISTRNLVYQQHTTGADIALTTRVVISKPVVLSGANTPNPTAATRIELAVTCK